MRASLAGGALVLADMVSPSDFVREDLLNLFIHINKMGGRRVPEVSADLRRHPAVTHRTQKRCQCPGHEPVRDHRRWPELGLTAGHLQRGYPGHGLDLASPGVLVPAQRAREITVAAVHAVAAL